jgi:hypothetical protein
MKTSLIIILKYRYEQGKVLKQQRSISVSEIRAKRGLKQKMNNDSNY